MATSDAVVQSVHDDAHESAYIYASFGKIQVYGRYPEYTGGTPSNVNAIFGAILHTNDGFYTNNYTDKKFDRPARHWVSRNKRTLVRWPEFPIGDSTTTKYLMVNNRKIIMPHTVMAACISESNPDEEGVKTKYLKAILYNGFFNFVYWVRKLDGGPVSSSIIQVHDGGEDAIPIPDAGSAYRVEFNLSGTEAVLFRRQGNFNVPYKSYYVSCDDNTGAFGTGVVNVRQWFGDYSQILVTTSTDAVFSENSIVIHAMGYKNDTLGMVYERTETSTTHTETGNILPLHVTLNGVDIGTPVATCSNFTISDSGSVRTTLGRKFFTGSETTFDFQERETSTSRSYVEQFEYTCFFNGVGNECHPTVWIESQSPVTSPAINRAYRQFLHADFQNDLVIFMRRRIKQSATTTGGFSRGDGIYIFDAEGVAWPIDDVPVDAPFPNYERRFYQASLTGSNAVDRPEAIEIWYKGQVSNFVNFGLHFGDPSEEPVESTTSQLVTLLTDVGVATGNTTVSTTLANGYLPGGDPANPFSCVCSVPNNRVFFSVKADDGAWVDNVEPRALFKGFHLTFG